MRLLITTLLCICFLTVGLGQNLHQVTLGSEYDKQVYFAMATKGDTSVQVDTWDISFATRESQRGAIFINDSHTSSTPGVRLFRTTATTWDEDIDQASLTTADLLHNPYQSWKEGAFNSIASNLPYDYGWGTYDPTTDKIVGDKIYGLKLRDGSYLKIRIDSMSQGKYYIRYAGLDGSFPKTATIPDDKTTSSQVGFSFENRFYFDLPSGYDLIFKRYRSSRPSGSGTIEVTGVQLSAEIEAVALDGVDPDLVSYQDYNDRYSNVPITIGYDWKFLDLISGWMTRDDRTYFIKDRINKVYQLTFVSFDDATGTITFEIMKVGSVYADKGTKVQLELYPNPTTELLKFRSDVNQQMEYQIYNSDGKQVTSGMTCTLCEIDVTMLNAGQYYISLRGDHFNTVQQLVVR